MSRKQVVFLGICAGDKDLIRQWAASGDLPAFARLLEEGCTATQEGLPGVYVGAHWPSWITGCLPGKNRVHSWRQLRPGTYAEYRCQAGDHMQRRPFWEALSDAGRRVCILDIPHSRLSSGLNGIQTVEWGAHDGAYGFLASSPELERRIKAMFGMHPVSGNSDADRTPAELLLFRDELVRGVRMKGALTRHLYAGEDWDFFAQVFTEAHCGGHLLWHLHDDSYRWHRGDAESADGDALKDVYRAIDEELGRVLDGVRNDATILVLANHGMGAKYNANHMFERILLALGYAAPKPPQAEAPSLRKRIDPVLTRAWQGLPQGARDRLTPLRRLKRAIVDGDPSPPRLIDARKGVAFPVTNNSAHGAVRVNLIGREPEGLVAPGAEYEALLDSITMDLHGLRNLDTGGPIVAEIHRCDDLYAGPERHHLPDLFVTWTNDAPVRRVGSNKMDPIEHAYRYVRSGEHRPDGLLIARGPGIRPGHLDRPIRCVDFAPTIATMLGIAPDPDPDGRLIPELFADAVAA